MRALLTGLALLAALTLSDAPSGARAAEGPKLEHQSWSFDGPLGTFDRAAMQRGFQVYSEICSNCHSATLLSYRNLAALGYNEAEVKAFAAKVQVPDGPNDQGEMFERPGLPSDHFKSPFANEKAARAANNGALPKDFSLIVRARHGGPDYVYALMNSYMDPPPEVKMGDGMYYNAAFAGGQIAMPPPLSEGAITYADGTPATVPQMAHDVATFLTWASEPQQENRKRTGAMVMVFLVVFAGIMYAVKKSIWADIHRKDHAGTPAGTIPASY